MKAFSFLFLLGRTFEDLPFSFSLFSLVFSDDKIRPSPLHISISSLFFPLRSFFSFSFLRRRSPLRSLSLFLLFLSRKCCRALVVARHHHFFLRSAEDRPSFFSSPSFFSRMCIRCNLYGVRENGFFFPLLVGRPPPFSSRRVLEVLPLPLPF